MRLNKRGCKTLHLAKFQTHLIHRSICQTAIAIRVHKLSVVSTSQQVSIQFTQLPGEVHDSMSTVQRGTGREQHYSTSIILYNNNIIVTQYILQFYKFGTANNIIRRPLHFFSYFIIRRPLHFFSYFRESSSPVQYNSRER